MSEPRTTGWFDTHSRIRFYPLEPRAEEIIIEDIAHALSRITRWAGHSDVFYTVGMHSLYVAGAIQNMKFLPEVALAALLHDAAEAYLLDVPRPLKKSDVMAPYREAEDRLLEMIFSKFSLPWPVPGIVKDVDQTVLEVEARTLFMPALKWVPDPVAMPGQNVSPAKMFRGWSLDAVKSKFLATFEELEAQRHAAVTVSHGQSRSVTLGNGDNEQAVP